MTNKNYKLLSKGPEIRESKVQCLVYHNGHDRYGIRVIVLYIYLT